MSAAPLTVLIVGNGVAGPVLAMALQKISKHNIILVDAGPEEVQPIGAAVAIAPNGLNALKFIEADYIVTKKGGMMEQMTIGHGETNTRLVNEKIAEKFTEKYGFAVSDLV
jgi:2-polyprenyl-6-methoxyphenol hydroxylase-like FAD-dependent oxidoreductase